MSQDTFNKVITIMLTAYFMVLYAVSWYTGKALDLYNLAVFLAPILTNTVHIIAQNRLETLKVVKNGGSNA